MKQSSNKQPKKDKVAIFLVIAGLTILGLTIINEIIRWLKLKNLV